MFGRKLGPLLHGEKNIFQLAVRLIDSFTMIFLCDKVEVLSSGYISSIISRLQTSEICSYLPSG